MKETADREFTEEQKQYLQGFWSGVEARRRQEGLPTFAGTLGLDPAAVPPPAPGDLHRSAQDRFLAEGKKLSPEEVAKREKDPLAMWDELSAHAAGDRFPQGLDVFRFKFHGLFYVAPAQDAFMCRLRLPGGLLTSSQLRGIADLAARFGGGYADVTTRANFQIREISARHLLDVLTGLHDLGIQNRGAGADNIRNVTGSPTAGIDPQELYDTRPLTRELHHFIQNHRELYGLPRKFNIAFDGGGAIGVLEDTNDIGFAAARVEEGREVPAGVYFRVLLGGITGHRDFGRDTGLLLRPEECVPVAAAMVRVFIEHGDRTDRKRARLKYLLDQWGIDRFVEETERVLGEKLTRFPSEGCAPRGPLLKHGHLGFHPQKQEGLWYAGVALPVGRLDREQLLGLAELSDRHGSGTIRLTVWQNLLLSDIPGASIPAVKSGIAALGLSWSASSVRGGLVACTGSKGCRFASTDTKGHALVIADWLESRLELDQPINIHLTGCPHSCAQHFIGDLGLLGTRVAAGDDFVEGYHLYVGGGYAGEREIGRELYRDVPWSEVPVLLERILRGYLERRATTGESFREFVLRHPIEALRAIFNASGALAA